MSVNVAELMARRRATDEQLAVFVTGLDAVLMQWTALNLVTQHNDPTSAQSLREHLIGWFTEVGEVYSDEMEDYFEEFFLQTRFAAIEDGSPKEVGDALHQMYCECCSNNDASVRQYISSLEAYRQAGVAQMCTFHNEGGEGESDDEGCVDDYDDGDDPPEEFVAAPPPKAKSGKNNYVNAGGGWKTVTRR